MTKLSRIVPKTPKTHPSRPIHGFSQAYRRQGIGRGRLRAFMTAGVAGGATKMFLTTDAANTAARSLYDAMGGGLAAQGPTVNYWFLLDR